VKFEILQSVGGRHNLFIDNVYGGEIVRSQTYAYSGWQFQYSSNPWPKMTNAENFEIRTAIREMVTVLNVTDRMMK